MTNSLHRRSPDVLASGGRWKRPTSKGALAALTAAALLIAGGLALATRGSRSPAASGPVPTASASVAAAQAWRDAALADLRPLTGVAVNLGQGFTAWRTGKATAKDLGAALDRFELALVDAQTAIDRRAPLAGAPRAVVDLRLTADLYLAAVRVGRVATDRTAGALREQLVLQFSRLRNLGDRVFDQADAELAPLLGPRREVEGVTIVRAAEVPDWGPMRLAAGPPLAPAPSSTGTPRAYQSIRPTESVQDWIANVGALGIPSADEEAGALRSGSLQQLGQLATRLTAASGAIFGSPDPRGERLVSTRLQLGLLIDAEAARAAQAARLVKGTRLLAVAEALAAAGDLLWDPRLGERTTGFATS